MDSAKSFFPTRANIPSRHANKGKLYRLCRGVSTDDPAYSTLDPISTSNIFRDSEESKEVSRPIGGEDLFRRMELAAQERRLEGRKLRRTSREYHSRHVQTSMGIANPNIKRAVTDSDATVLDLKILLKHSPKPTVAQELFKSHQNYQPVSSERCSQLESLGKKKGLARSLHTIQPKFAPMQAIERIDRQVQEYQDKSALLGEMDRGRPLVQRCGDAYFQMTLRNRFEDDLKMPNFIYRIKDKFSENKVISKLRSFKPGLLERRQLVLKGHRRTESTIQ